MQPALVLGLREQLADRFRLRILSGVLAPGEPLREESLARELGISRGPLRDTFLQLTQEGLLVARPHAGVRVADAPSPFKRKALVRLRRTVETEALNEWFRHRAGDLPGQMARNLQAYEPACRSEDLEWVVGLDMAFHRLIMASADGGSLIPVWLPVISQMFLRYSRHHSLVESFEEHRGIHQAIQADDRKAAARLLRDHIV